MKRYAKPSFAAAKKAAQAKKGSYSKSAISEALRKVQNG